MHNGHAPDRPTSPYLQFNRPRKGSYCDYKKQKIITSGTANDYTNTSIGEVDIRKNYGHSSSKNNFMQMRKQPASFYQNETANRRNSISFYERSRPQAKFQQFQKRKQHNDAEYKRYGSKEIYEVNRQKIRNQINYQPINNKSKISNNNFLAQGYLDDTKFNSLQNTKSVISRTNLNQIANYTSGLIKKKGQIYQNSKKAYQDQYLNEGYNRREKDLRNFEDKSYPHMRITSGPSYQQQHSHNQFEYQTFGKFKPDRYDKNNQHQFSYISKRQRNNQINFNEQRKLQAKYQIQNDRNKIGTQAKYQSYQNQSISPRDRTNRNQVPFFKQEYDLRNKQAVRRQNNNIFCESNTLNRSLKPSSHLESSANAAMTQSRRQLLIDKSKALFQKMNELSATKPILKRDNTDIQKQTINGSKENYEERLQKIRNNKQRAYDSPFKDRLKSTNDLRSKYQLPTQFNSNTQMENQQQSNQGLKNLEMNKIHMPSNGYERSQDLKKLSTTQSQSLTANNGNSGKINPQQKIFSADSSSNCMNRINSLNSKINDKISSLISAYQRK